MQTVRKKEYTIRRRLKRLWDNGVNALSDRWQRWMEHFPPKFSVQGTVITKCRRSGRICVIPEWATGIGESAFEDCRNLTEITIPKGVTFIGNSAFGRCRKLTCLDLPDGVTSIGEWAFACCDSLCRLTLPNSVQSIGFRAFYDCKSLTEITIPGNVKKIGFSLFFCSKLTRITILPGVTTIEPLIDFCPELVRVDLPDTVHTIADRTFRGCRNLNEITIPPGAIIGERTFEGAGKVAAAPKNPFLSSDETGCLFDRDRKTLIHVPAGFSGHYVIPDGVAIIGDGAFYCCGNLTGVTIPDSVTNIGEEAFAGCDSLTEVTVPAGVATIGGRAFPKQTKLNILGRSTKFGNYIPISITEL